MKRASKYLLPLALLTLSCAAPEHPGPRSSRLVDLFSEATVTGTPETAEAPARTEWRFDGGGDWEAGPGLAGVETRDGRLVARTTTETSLLHLERPEVNEGEDVVHAVEVRGRVSAGRDMAVYFSGDDEVDLAALAASPRGFPGDNQTPVVPEDEIRTYTITPSRPVAASQTRHVLLRPTDAAGAEVEIESVRLVFRREHLAGVPSGIGWHGLDDVYRETVVARAPETVSYALALPRRPRLDLAIGTVENEPVTFTVEMVDGADATTVLERTVTRPHRWDVARLDLAEHGGRDVELRLRLTAATPGALGFWGTPVVRDLDAAPAGDAPRGVVMIVADTLRTDHLDLYGYGRPTAPVLAGVAAEGTSFASCIAQGTWTKVSFSSILSGLHPPSHGVKAFHDRLPAAATTLAEVFRDAGYATLSLSSIVFNGKFTNLHQGFEELHEAASLPDDANSKTAIHHVDRLLPWLEAHREVPFFVLLHVADPHAPYRPYGPYDRMWASPERAAEFEAEVEKVLPVIEDSLMRRFRMPTTTELESVGLDPDRYVAHELDWYDGSIRAMDAELGRLFERLRELEIDDRTLVAFLSDHGTEFLEHGRHWHGHSVYGELNQVPLFFRGPGVPAGEVRTEVVQTIDVMPTVLELAGLPVPEDVQGRSLVPLMRGEEWRPRPAFSYKASIEGAGPPPLSTEALALVGERWKLVRLVDGDGNGAGDGNGDDGGEPRYELYDHRVDPLNRHDVAAEHPEVVERLAAELDGWRREAEARKLDETSLGDLSAEELERLRSLGYVN